MKKNSQKHVETMIGEDAVINGEIILQGGAIISGKVVGNVHTEGTVRVTSKGTIEGDMKALEATIGGAVHGNVEADKVVLRSACKVHGDIIYKQLMIEEGASFEGRCDLVSSKTQEETAAPITPSLAKSENSEGESSPTPY